MRVEVEGFEERVVRNAKKKRRRRVEEKSKKRNFGERSLVGLSLFHAFAMEKECLRYQSFVFYQWKEKGFFYFRLDLGWSMRDCSEVFFFKHNTKHCLPFLFSCTRILQKQNNSNVPNCNIKNIPI